MASRDGSTLCAKQDQGATAVSKLEIWTDETALRGAVELSSSLARALSHAGLSKNNMNYRKFRAACAVYGISTEFPMRYKQARRYPDEAVFIEGSAYLFNHGLLKQRALLLGFIENKCSECGQGPEWVGKLLTLQLDHINGVPNDHRPSNLRMLCPNCHSQTPTYAGRDRHGKAEPVKKIGSNGLRGVTNLC